jgi:hypothetical protein
LKAVQKTILQSQADYNSNVDKSWKIFLKLQKGSRNFTGSGRGALDLAGTVIFSRNWKVLRTGRLENCFVENLNLNAPLDCERPLIPAFSPVGEKVAGGRMRG